jgi:hypothetical protein
LDHDAHRLLRRPAPWIALLIAAAIVTPNMLWNIKNNLATFRHTGDNIQGSGIAFNPFIGLEFFSAQFLVFGPIVFAVLLGAMVRIASPAISRADRLMLAFAIPPLALVTTLAFVTRALANWAAPAFLSAVIVVVAILIHRGVWKWLAISIGLGVIAQAAMLAGDARATRVHVPWLANGDLYHRTLGWRALGERAGELARQIGARAIVGELRDDEASLIYYWRDQPEQILAWQRGPVPDHQFEISRALTGSAPLPLLFVSRCSASDRLAAQFTSVEPLGQFEAATGPTTKRTYFAFKLDGPRGPIRPLGGCG